MNLISLIYSLIMNYNRRRFGRLLTSSVTLLGWGVGGVFGWSSSEKQNWTLPVATSLVYIRYTKKSESSAGP